MLAGDDDQRAVLPENGVPEGSPAGWLWLVYLYFKPHSFFKHFVIESTPGLTVLCAWLYGMAGVIDELESRALMDPSFLDGVTWSQLWIGVLLLGVVGGWWYFKIGGWWYRKRLGFSGAESIDKRLARRVYVFASLAWALPTLLAQIVASGSFASPRESVLSDLNLWDGAVMLSLPWSLWVSYVGVRTAFEVRRGRAMLWFLLLPGGMFFFVIAAAAALALVQALGPADTTSPLRFGEGQTLTFSYPGNWWIGDDDPDYDPDSYVTVEPMQDALVKIMVYELQQDIVDELEASINSYREALSDLEKTDEFESWGRYRGLGQECRGVIEGRRYTLRLFISESQDGVVFEIREWSYASNASQVVPGFELIRSTFRLK